jgi:hypothetical protein
MSLRCALLVLVAFVACPALAQSQAFTNRVTDLKEQATPDSRTVASLPENTEVKVLARGGGWTQVEASGKPGWVRVFHLRFPASASTSESSSGGGLLGGLTSALGGGRQRSQSTTIATTGIRGLSPEELKNASPDPEALRRMQSYRADAGSAERFAREGRLAAVPVDYNEAGRR